jgi:hypothetical protein
MCLYTIWTRISNAKRLTCSFVNQNMYWIVQWCEILLIWKRMLQYESQKLDEFALYHFFMTSNPIVRLVPIHTHIVLLGTPADQQNRNTVLLWPTRFSYTALSPLWPLTNWYHFHYFNTRKKHKKMCLYTIWTRVSNVKRLACSFVHQNMNLIMQ